MEALDQDVVWHSVGDAALPWAGLHRGRAGVEAYFARLDPEVRITGYELERIIAQGEWVVALARVRVRFLKDGSERSFDKADVFRLRDGRIAEFREFYDTALAARGCAA
jgi:ketosteroid isomerase-like protein